MSSCTLCILFVTKVYRAVFLFWRGSCLVITNICSLTPWSELIGDNLDLSSIESRFSCNLFSSLFFFSCQYMRNISDHSFHLLLSIRSGAITSGQGSSSSLLILRFPFLQQFLMPLVAASFYTSSRLHQDLIKTSSRRRMASRTEIFLARSLVSAPIPHSMSSKIF